MKFSSGSLLQAGLMMVGDAVIKLTSLLAVELMQPEIIEPDGITKVSETMWMQL